MVRDDLIIKLRALMLDIIGVEIYHIDIDEDLRGKESFDKVSEELLKESITEDFNIDVDLSTMKTLTLDKIADYIKKENQYDLRESGVKYDPGKTLVMG
jgi:hypothetical protein